mmetsp:Transcript_6797/g.10692  ORF Transcript_6797/g.10692 Transcript_6797/m.10692 type:complete len:229 (-) Transcript_6797:453-1139(-)
MVSADTSSDSLPLSYSRGSADDTSSSGSLPASSNKASASIARVSFSSLSDNISLFLNFLGPKAFFLRSFFFDLAVATLEVVEEADDLSLRLRFKGGFETSIGGGGGGGGGGARLEEDLRNVFFLAGAGESISLPPSCPNSSSSSSSRKRNDFLRLRWLRPLVCPLFCERGVVESSPWGVADLLPERRIPVESCPPVFFLSFNFNKLLLVFVTVWSRAAGSPSSSSLVI